MGLRIKCSVFTTSPIYEEVNVMKFEEMNLIEAPSDGQFWGGVAVGTILVVGVGAIICC